MEKTHTHTHSTQTNSYSQSLSLNMVLGWCEADYGLLQQQLDCLVYTTVSPRIKGAKG